MTTGNALELAGVRKVYGAGDGAVTALDGVTANVPRGTFTAVMGPSGSGKSTFLHCAAGLDRPTSGKVVLGGTEIGRLKENELTRLRRTRVGFVFQAYNLLPSLNVLQNITLPMRLAGAKPTPSGCARSSKASASPSGWSTGRRSCRAGSSSASRSRGRSSPGPTSCSPTSRPARSTAAPRATCSTCCASRDGMGQTVLMVTHDPVAAAHADTVLFLVDGKLAGHLTHPTPERVAERMTHLGEW